MRLRWYTGFLSLFCSCSVLVLGCQAKGSDGASSSRASSAAPRSNVAASSASSKVESGGTTAVSADPDHSITVRWTGKIVESSGKPSYEIELKNTGKKTIVGGDLYVFCYGADKKVAGYDSTTANSELAPGETFVFPLDVHKRGSDKEFISGKPDLSVELWVHTVMFTRDDQWVSHELEDIDPYDRPMGGPHH